MVTLSIAVACLPDFDVQVIRVAQDLARPSWNCLIKVRISDKFCQILKEVLPLSALAIQLNYPKTKDKFCRDSQN